LIEVYEDNVFSCNLTLDQLLAAVLCARTFLNHTECAQYLCDSWASCFCWF